MQESPKQFKRPPKRFQPKGLSILYEDFDIIVVDKMSGLLSISNEQTKDNTAYFRLNTYVRKGNQKSRKRVFIVHRLDKDTSGVLVFAKSEVAKQFLQNEWKDFRKMYYAVVQGELKDKEGVISSYLAENSFHKMYSVPDPNKGVLAKTKYKVLKSTKHYSLLEIILLTGKKNQIRVHFSEKGCPVAGDKKYGAAKTSVKRLTLHAASMTILHPVTKQKMTFESEMPAYFNSLMNH